MKWVNRSIKLIVGLVLLCFLAPTNEVSAQERIILFDATIQVEEDASLLVTETIKIYSTGDIFKRGIVRSFPVVRSHPNHERRIRVGFDILEITKDGLTEPYHTESGYQTVDIYVGESDVFLDTNREYTYTITYRTTKQLVFFDDFDELYWNVNGNGWALQFDKVAATVILPESVRDSVLQSAAYTGYDGDQGTDYTESRTAEGHYRFETTRALNPYEGMTIAVGWPIGAVARPTAEELAREQMWRESGNYVIKYGAILVMLFYAFFWYKVGVDPRKGTIIPLFTPPQDLSPSALRYVERMGSDTKVFSAAVLSMAVKGWVIINQTKKKYSLQKADTRKEELKPEERAVFSGLISGRSSIELDQKNHSTFSSAQRSMEKLLKAAHNKTHFNRNTGYIVGGVILSLVITVISLIMISLFADIDGEEMLPIFLISFFSFFVIPFMYSWVVAIKNAWISPSWSTILGAVALSIIIVPLGIGYTWSLFAFSWEISQTLCIGMMIIFAANLIFAGLMKAPTKIGRKLMDDIEGFRMYLAAAEQDRLEFLHPPEKTPELFERYLPYAVALNVENKWATQFNDVFARLEQTDQGGYRPAFYHGTMSSFNASSFTNDVGSRLTSSLGSASTSPSSSSSGSGGGGSSGGGGGGGGGGGW